MSSLKRRYRNFKKSKSNPYAGRGLDKFALVTAELEAKRESLATELDTPLSMVKFALGSHNRWVPIILSRSTKKESHPCKKKTRALVNEDKLSSSSRACKDGSHKGGRTSSIKEGKVCCKGAPQCNPKASAGSVGSNVYRQDSHFNGSIAENIDMSCERNSLGDDLHKKGSMYIDNAFDEDRLHADALMQKKRSTLGSSSGIEDEGEIIEFFSAASEAEHIATYKEEEAAVLHHRNLKKVIGAIAAFSWIVSKASTIASSVVFLKWHAKTIASDGNSLSSEIETSRDAEQLEVAKVSMHLSSPSVDKTIALPSVLSLPSAPAPVRISSKTPTSEQDEIVEVMEDADAPQQETAVKQHRKCKVKGLLKIRSAPSTPRDSRQPKKSFTAASTLSKATVAVEKEAELLAPRTKNSHTVLVKRHFGKVSPTDTRRESARRVGHALAAAGLVLSLSGLVLGYFSAIIGVVCWWYVLPSLRKAVGDKPRVRSHHHSHVNNKALTATIGQAKVEKITKEVGSGNFQDYKKKIIMEGLLDRGRRSNS
ncbi:hypothetical protein L7F22_030139 [Adiantum nelumboides]|nr:hypothetical protein [Adiantum nelumboides]